MKDERFDSEELERVKAEARHGRGEAEDQRLMELGRRVEALLESEESPQEMRQAVYAGGYYLDNAWAWFRSTLKEESHG